MKQGDKLILSFDGVSRELGFPMQICGDPATMRRFAESILREIGQPDDRGIESRGFGWIHVDVRQTYNSPGDNPVRCWASDAISAIDDAL